MNSDNTPMNWAKYDYGDDKFYKVYITENTSANPKCLILSGLFSIGYVACSWDKKKKYYGINPLIIVLIYLFTYVAIAWYDEIFECRKYLLKTGVGETGEKIWVNPDSIFKPRAKAQPEYYYRTVYTFHLLVIAPLLMYIGYYREKSNPFVMSFLGGLGLLAGVYHGAMLRTELEEVQSY